MKDLLKDTITDIKDEFVEPYSYNSKIYRVIKKYHTFLLWRLKKQNYFYVDSDYYNGLTDEVERLQNEISQLKKELKSKSSKTKPIVIANPSINNPTTTTIIDPIKHKCCIVKIEENNTNQVLYI